MFSVFCISEMILRVVKWQYALKQPASIKTHGIVVAKYGIFRCNLLIHRMFVAGLSDTPDKLYNFGIRSYNMNFSI